MLEDVVLGIQQTFGGLDVDVDVDPVLCRAVVEFRNAVREEPFVNEI
jgi:hypothetical protein